MTSLNACAPDPVAGQPHILVMEDEHMVAKGLEMVLEEEGYAVDLAYTGNQALKDLAEKHFELLIADLRLPDLDGMEVVRTVKQTRPETEVVVITGYSSVASAVDAMKLGVFDYLTKPFTESEIKTAVSEALHQLRQAPPARIQDRVSGEEYKLIQKRELLRVLNRTAEDHQFWLDLMENGAAALADYHLGDAAKAAIASGDLAWINKNVGELSQKQLLFIYSRLAREAW